MRNNYPIKYALVPIKGQLGWIHGLNELEREYGTIYYIVSKCYLVCEEKKYNNDGEYKMKYHIVPPYEKFQSNVWERVEPDFRCTDTCVNSIDVDNVYDNLDDAYQAKELFNKKLLAQRLIGCTEDKIEEQQREFFDLKEYYDELEELIDKKICELKVNDIGHNYGTVEEKNGLYERTKYSIYDLMGFYLYNNFIVYHVDKNDLELFNGVDEVKCSKLIENCGEEVTMKLYMPGEVKYICNGLIKDNIDFDFNINKYDYVFYTAEDYQDILDTYKFNNHDVRYIRVKK